MTVRIERHDPRRIGPAWMRPYLLGGPRIGQIRLMRRIERARSDRERAIDPVRAGVRSDHVAVFGMRERADERPARAGSGRSPMNGQRLDAVLFRVREQANVSVASA